MKNVIEIRGLSKDYEKGFWKKKKIRALDGLDLDVAPGQIYGFLGGNGAGKTTTIKILMGLIFPSGGTAKILGKDISDVEVHSRIGYCPENPYFYDYLKATELMDYFGQLFGLEASKRKKVSEDLLARVGLEEKDWTKQLRKFSKGMLQRVGIAQSLVNDPELVVLDEPMSGLDPVGRREIRELIAGLRQAGKTVFMSSHILSDIEALCDNVAILRSGTLVATGRLEELLASEDGDRAFEISANGVKAAELISIPEAISGAVVTEKPSGASIQVFGDENIGTVLTEIKKAGGNVVSVQPVRQSLEELFVKETTDS
ncbi:MAG: ABC transporter ATP-binding protein [Acidobacteria bacterium]|nr:MAG: ABC transporter ATP-binding protein [Acidobacteriota bacterium]REK02285.1 MAG: ABC transporter ATP-binding protein [Acidobacteriota bacterium]REK13912.1 MAG: ABC transporter ATP-binding protein [Acidobacteriota bacterium]REK41906.1 MAG: ABC transporter ATP-binding protein [Acidobacteriota bacterium]